jgi:hypothetical protein
MHNTIVRTAIHLCLMKCSEVDNINMQETKFLLHGQFHRANGWIMNDCLSYIKATKEEAIATCNRLNPNFVIQSITVEE